MCDIIKMCIYFRHVRGDGRMKQLTKMIALIFSLIFVFAGCNSLGNISRNLTAPQPSGVYHDIMQGLIEVTGKNPNLVYARSGKYLSSIVAEDIDGDGGLEAVAFYRTVTDDKSSVIHVNYIINDHEADKWISVSDIELSYTGLESVEFADMDGDGCSEIIVGLIPINSLNFDIIVFKFDEGALIPIFQKQYTTYTVYKANDKGSNYLVTVRLNTEEKHSVATVYAYSDGVMVPTSQCTLDGEVTSYDTPIITKTVGSKNAILIDAVKSSGMITEVLTNIDTVITAPYNDAVTGHNETTLRNSTTRCLDYNQDGSYEVPFNVKLPTPISLSESDGVYLVTWKNFNGSGFNDLANTTINAVDGYMLEIPDEWIGRFTVVRNLDEKMRTFYEWNNETKTIGSEIFRIKVFNISDWEKMKNDRSDYFEITKDFKYVYAGCNGTSELFRYLNDINSGFRLVEGS